MPKEVYIWVRLACCVLAVVSPSKICIQEMLDKREEVYTQEQRTNAWSDAAGMVQNYSDDMVARWNKEIDTYLVFVRFSLTHGMAIN